MHCYILILFNVFFFTFVNDKVVTYVKNLIEKKILLFQSIYILLVQNWIMKAMNLISIKGLLLTISIPIRHYGFIVFKIEYDIIEEFEKEKSYSKLLYWNDVDF